MAGSGGGEGGRPASLAGEAACAEGWRGACRVSGHMGAHGSRRGCRGWEQSDWGVVGIEGAGHRVTSAEPWTALPATLRKGGPRATGAVAGTGRKVPHPGRRLREIPVAAVSEPAPRLTAGRRAVINTMKQELERREGGGAKQLACSPRRRALRAARGQSARCPSRLRQSHRLTSGLAGSAADGVPDAQGAGFPFSS